MEAYRDQYATLFNGGKNVVVFGISVDPDTALYSWARDSHFPMLFGSDSNQAVGKLYGAASGKYDARFLFVVGPDGRITHRMIPFNVLSAAAYTELAAAVAEQVGSGRSGSP